MLMIVSATHASDAANDVRTCDWHTWLLPWMALDHLTALHLAIVQGSSYTLRDSDPVTTIQYWT